MWRCKKDRDILQLKIKNLEHGINEAERMIARKFLNVYGMVVMMSATFLDPGEVTLHSTPIRGWLNVGRYPYGLDSITKKVSSVISHSQMSSNENSQIMRLKYTKLKHNLNNALDALVGNSGRGGEVHKELNSEARNLIVDKISLNKLSFCSSNLFSSTNLLMVL